MKPLDAQRSIYNMTNHRPNDEGIQKMETLRQFAKQFATSIHAQVPDSREKSIALTHLEEALFWANAGVARDESNQHKEIN